MIQTLHPIPVKHLRLLVWDLDGTLVDSLEDLAGSVNALRQARGLPELPLETVRGFVGKGARNLVQRALGGAAPALDEALDFFFSHYRRHLLDHTKAYPGIPEVLETLRQRGFLMAVLTNKPFAFSEAILQGLGLAPFFERVLGGDNAPARKPDPAGARALLHELGVAPDEALMIGDSDNDVLTARGAGLWSLGVTYGYAPDSFAQAEPDARVADGLGLAGLLAP